MWAKPSESSHHQSSGRNTFLLIVVIKANLHSMTDTSLLFLDFEASSLAADSWPVEIGLSSVSLEGVETWASLIRPRPTWSMDAWNPHSALIHGIPRTELDAAPSADEVATMALSRMEGKILVSDAPEFEVRWLHRLLEGRVVEGIKIADFDHIAARRFESRTLDWVYEGLERRRAPHRAGPDSARLAGAWHDGLRREAL